MQFSYCLSVFMEVAAAQWNLVNFAWSLEKPSVRLGRIGLLRVMW